MRLAHSCIPVLLLLLAGGCSAPESEPGPPNSILSDSSIVDALGRSVRVPVPLGRVASLAPSITEMMVLAGGANAVAGITTADNHPASILSKPAYSALPVDFESIASLRPDAVFATTQVNAPRDADVFARLGIPELFFETRRVGDIIDGIRTMGRLFGTAERAGHAADSLESRIASLRQRTDGIVDRPRVLVLIAAETPWSFGPESYVHELLEWAGGVSVTADFPTEAPVLSEEFVIEAAPDVILGTFRGDDPLADLLVHHPAWSAIPAIANGRVIAVPADLVLRAGPRVVEGAWVMARALHPDVMAGTE